MPQRWSIRLYGRWVRDTLYIFAAAENSIRDDRCLRSSTENRCSLPASPLSAAFSSLAAASSFSKLPIRPSQAVTCEASWAPKAAEFSPALFSDWSQLFAAFCSCWMSVLAWSWLAMICSVLNLRQECSWVWRSDRSLICRCRPVRVSESQTRLVTVGKRRCRVLAT